MTFGYFLERTYWCAIILSPAAYLALNFDAYQKTKNGWLLLMAMISFSMVITGSVSFLLCHSAVIQGSIREIQLVLLIVPIVRVPIDVWFYYKFLSDFKALALDRHDEKPV